MRPFRQPASARARAIAAISLLACAACGSFPAAAGGLGGDPGAPSDPGEGDGTGTTPQCTVEKTPFVTVAAADTVIDGQASSDSPARIYGFAVDTAACAALEPTAQGGAYIAGLPPGTPFRFQWSDDYSTYYTDTAARALDLGAFVAGRRGAETPCESCQTFATLRIDGLAPWGANDTVQIFVPGTNAAGKALENVSLSSPPAVGDTALAIGFDWNDVTPPALVSATQGDVAYVSQLAAHGSAPAQYQSIAALATFDHIEQAQGTTTPFVGSFAAAPQGLSISVDLHGTAFAALASDVSPHTTSHGATFSVQTLPGAAHGLFGNGADLLVVPETSADVSFGSLAYGDPYPAAWGSLAVIEEDFAVAYDGGSTKVAYVDVEDPATISAGPVVPKLSPPRHPTLDGRDATVAGAGVSMGTLAWDAPAVGAPTAYVVRIHTVGSRTIGAILTTASTSIELPDADQTCANGCIFEIDAVASPLDVTAQPNRTSLPYTSAPAVSALVYP